MTDLVPWITQRRFDEYMVAANHDADAARELYEWNISVSAAFFELISHVEVALRNAVDNILKPLEITESARVAVRHGWWFASPAFLTDHDLDFHRTAWRHLGNKATAAPRDKVLSSMAFGIWDAVFGPSYEQLFRRHLVYAFPNRGPGFKRETVRKNVLALRNLRNRVAHHQAIFDLPLEERYEQAMELLSWIDPALEQWVSHLCRVPGLLDDRPGAAESIAVILPAREEWPFYEQNAAYICQPGRFFTQVSHIGFYASNAVQSEVPKILERLDHVAWTSEEIGRRMRSGSEQDLPEIVKNWRNLGWTDNEYQLFLLTGPDDEGRSRGHVTLDSPLVNHRVGRGSAWVRRQRYVAVSGLQSSKALAELEQP
ncbi:Abi family protein [Arthrobacter sp. 2MCAF14]|uniref:Abi family protein n=1 Tax=Arthrobacter sp. 2MCAF14 TaxID=3232982 RepID=UPI003F8E36B4